MKHVKASSLSQVFNSDWSIKQEAINKGVDYNSIIYITCSKGDEVFGKQYKEGTTWIWAKGEIFGEDVSNKQDVLTPGRGIKIEDNIIFATGTSKWEDEPDDEVFEEEIQLVTYEEVKEFLNRQL